MILLPFLFFGDKLPEILEVLIAGFLCGGLAASAIGPLGSPASGERGDSERQIRRGLCRLGPGDTAAGGSNGYLETAYLSSGLAGAAAFLSFFLNIPMPTASGSTVRGS